MPGNHTASILLGVKEQASGHGHRSMTKASGDGDERGLLLASVPRPQPARLVPDVGGAVQHRGRVSPANPDLRTGQQAPIREAAMLDAVTGDLNEKRRREHWGGCEPPAVHLGIDRPQRRAVEAKRVEATA